MASKDERGSKGSELENTSLNVNGENVSERMQKYRVESDSPRKEPVQVRSEESSSRKTGQDENSSVFSDDSGRFYFMGIKAKSFPTNSAAAKVMKSKGKGYEHLAMTGGRPGLESNHDFERLRINGQNQKSVNNEKYDSRGQNPQSDSSSLREMVEITIPKDGNIQHFSVDELSSFFRWMNIDERIVQRLNTKQLDGRKFGKLKDKTLEDIGIKNPIILYFRDKSNKGRINFIL